MPQALTELAQTAIAHWPFQVSDIELLKFRENAVFKLVLNDGSKRVLRIHRPGYMSVQEIQSELQWIDALAKAGLEVPKVVPATSGALLVKLFFGKKKNGDSKIDRAKLYVIDMFEWVDGEMLSGIVARVLNDPASVSNFTSNSASNSASNSGAMSAVNSYFGQIGGIMGQLHNHAADWSPPAGFTRHAWDLDGLVGDRPFWDRFWELDLLNAEETYILTQARQRLKKDLAATPKTAATYGLIHADLNMDNVLVHDGRVQVIDFDDAGFGWHMFDIATTLNYLSGRPFEAETTAAFFEGYRQHRPLSADSLARLPMFWTVRRLTYVGWIIERQDVVEITERAPVLIERGVTAAEAYLAG